MEVENLKLKQRVTELEEALKEMNEALKESTKLLVKTRPSRPPIPHERKLLVAAAQKWKCANPFGMFLLYKVGEGYFDESLLEADHIDPYSKSFRSVANIACLRASAHFFTFAYIYPPLFYNHAFARQRRSLRLGGCRGRG